MAHMWHINLKLRRKAAHNSQTLSGVSAAFCGGEVSLQGPVSLEHVSACHGRRMHTRQVCPFFHGCITFSPKRTHKVQVVRF